MGEVLNVSGFGFLWVLLDFSTEFLLDVIVVKRSTMDECKRNYVSVDLLKHLMELA